MKIFYILLHISLIYTINMLKNIFIIGAIIFLSACSSSWDKQLTQEDFIEAYKLKDRSVTLSENTLKGFVSLNGFNGDTEIVNLYLDKNEIEVLNISEYKDLWRLVISNNNIRFFGDIQYPEKIRHIDISFNQLENLDGIEKLTELKTLNVSYNKLNEQDFQKLASLTKLQLVYADGNNVSIEFLQRLATFNSKYLGTIK